MPRDDVGRVPLWITIPRTEEFYDKGALAKGGRTVFIVQIHCKGTLASLGSGSSTQTWELKKRYGYFERVHKYVARCAQAANEPPPSGARRLAPNSLVAS